MQSDGFLWKGRLGHIFCKLRKPGSSVSYPLDHSNFSSPIKEVIILGPQCIGGKSATSEHFSFPWTGNSPIFCNKWALKTSFVNYSLESQSCFWLHRGNLLLQATLGFLYHLKASQWACITFINRKSMVGEKKKRNSTGMCWYTMISAKITYLYVKVFIYGAFHEDFIWH